MPRAYISGVNLHYEVSGIGPCVVLCHGYPASHQVWMFQIPVLSQNYQVVTMDHRGHGSSDAPSSADAYSFSIFANDVRGLIDYLGITKCCLVGHSMGGYIALRVALDSPSLISSLVLVSTSSGRIDIPGYAELRARLGKIARRDGMEAVFDYTARHHPLYRKRLERHPELREIFRRRTLETPVDGYIYTGQVMSHWPNLTDRLGEISVPTLVVVGEEDNPLRQPAETLAEGIPNARLYVVPQATHSPQEERSEAFNKLILDFLAEVESN